MPGDVHAQMVHSFDSAINSKIIPSTALINNKIDALSAAHTASAGLATQNARDIGKTTKEAMSAMAAENREVSTRLENGLKMTVVSQ
jgi:hypothetical protein